MSYNMNFSIKQTKMDESVQGSAYQGEQKGTRLAYIETYGCQMNFADTEIVASILQKEGFGFTQDPFNADLILINTCSIREHAEERVRHRLDYFVSIKRKKPGILIGILGCMAERLKKRWLEESHIVDLVVGPDAYRDLPNLIAEAETGGKGINVLLSREETYADISPVRLHSNGVSAFISIMRGCNNMCTFCVVPFTRGRERSRPPKSILREIKELQERGFKEVTLLGQNVDSYHYEQYRFEDLLKLLAEQFPSMRIRFTTSHPKDMTDEVLFTIAAYPNIGRYIHLPVQSGSNRILKLMRRGYTREWYLERIEKIRSIIPDCTLSTDIIAGFCSETEEDHQMTLSLMNEVRFDSAYTFYYSEREGTYAAKFLQDNVPLAVKKRRLQEIIELQQTHSLESNQKDIGKIYEVLIEGNSKKDSNMWMGRNSQNKVIVFPKEPLPIQKGDIVKVKIESATSATLIGKLWKWN